MRTRRRLGLGRGDVLLPLFLVPGDSSARHWAHGVVCHGRVIKSFWLAVFGSSFLTMAFTCESNVSF
jgi:hypothetical protein